MNTPGGDRITSIHRPIGDLCWVPDVHDYLAETYSRSVVLNPATSYVLEVVKNRELNNVVIPPTRSASYVKGQMLTSMPSSFQDKLSVDVTGASYFKDKTRLRNRLIIKLGCSLELLAENDAVFEALAPYGLLPDNDRTTIFNITIGSVALNRLYGQQKEQLRFGLTDRIPKKLALLPGVIHSS